MMRPAARVDNKCEVATGFDFNGLSDKIGLHDCRGTHERTMSCYEFEGSRVLIGDSGDSHFGSGRNSENDLPGFSPAPAVGDRISRAGRRAGMSEVPVEQLQRRARSRVPGAGFGVHHAQSRI